MAQWKRTLGLFQSSELLVVLEWASKFKMLSSYVRKPCNVASILPFRHLKEKKADIKIYWWYHNTGIVFAHAVSCIIGNFNDSVSIRFSVLSLKTKKTCTLNMFFFCLFCCNLISNKLGVRSASVSDCPGFHFECFAFHSKPVHFLEKRAC